MKLPAKQGRLTPIAHAIRHYKTERRRAYRCQCDCGEERIVEVGDFRKGLWKSCGCYKRDRMRGLTLTHDGCRKPEYRVWHSMKNRCSNPRLAEFKYYGGRGITVCDRWANSFAAFLADMGPRPSLNHSLDRRDNERGYEPTNCSWQTSQVQARNRRTTRLHEAFGRTQCVSEWAREFDVLAVTIFSRLRKGLSMEEALTIPLNDCAALRIAMHR